MPFLPALVLLFRTKRNCTKLFKLRISRRNMRGRDHRIILLNNPIKEMVFVVYRTELIVRVCMWSMGQQQKLAKSKRREEEKD